ncbi:MAG: porin [Thiobacillus sp.]|nr:porin [Thiobacillus sp.]
MMKKILAAAIVSAFAAPAFAATANVDVYGQFRGSVDFVDADGAANEGRTRVSSNNSRIGFKGAEDLGGGLSAIWQWEYAFQLDQQGATQPQTATDSVGGNSYRNTFVGLSSKTLGALTLGTQESPLKTSTGPLAVFGDTLADYRSVFTKLSTRSDNSILYTSPDMGGLTLQAMYGAQNEAGNGTLSDPTFYALSGVYKNGPLYATLAYQDAKAVSSTNVSSNTKAWRAGVGYTFGNTKLGLAYENNDAESAAGVTTNDGSAWYLSVAHKMGNVTLNAAYTDRDEYTSGANNGAQQYTVGAEYALSKRTGVYALYTKVSNDTNGTNGIGPSTGIATVSTVAGGDASGLSLGVNHSF